MTAVNIKTGQEVELLTYDAIASWVSARKSDGCKFIGHNILGYDAPTLNRLCGTGLVVTDLIDTLLLSMLYSPSLSGGHSLGDWGVRLRYPKGEFNDWHNPSQVMYDYCMQDSRLCRRIYIELVKRMMRAKFSNEGIENQHRAWQLIQTQKKNGFAFDIKGAHILYAKLGGLLEVLTEKVYEQWPPSLEVVARYRQSHKKNGDFTQHYLRHQEQFVQLELHDDGGYSAYDYVSFNIGSAQQRVEKLVELGWRHLPDEVTKGGAPKPTDKGRLVPSLVKFVEENPHPGPKLIAEWMELNSRASMINTWMEAYNDDTGCIHGSLWLANTLRYKHSSPNTANIPAVRVRTLHKGTPEEHDVPILGAEGAYTYEARDLWGTRDRRNRRLVGVDAKGIQLRVLAHYLNNPAFTEAVLGGDPHSYNQQIGGFTTRAIAKTFIYAFLLGCGDAKAGSIIGGSPRDGRDIKARFIGNFPGLAQLLDRLEKEISSTGRLRLIDGTPIIVTQMHTRLGYLLQGDEQCILKKAMIYVHQRNLRQRLDVLKVGDIHDEWQSDVSLSSVDQYIANCKESFPAVRDTFRYNIPLDCDAKIGLTWAETH